MSCHYFVLPQRAEDRVLEVLVRKTETIRRELGSLSKVIDDDVERRLRGGTRHQDADARHWERRLAHFDADLEREPERIRRFYDIQLTRVEPVGLVYLWPETN